tara:strand:+ start:42 stop:1043 length:1002 start_codon:yes stop_codon:yes gene_type:complete
MALIALRNPQYKFIPVPSSGVLSTKCAITIDGTLRYTIIKNNPNPLDGSNFEISELARDYLDIIWSYNSTPQSVTITTVLTNYAGLNGTGSVVGNTQTYIDLGFEAFGYYEEAENPAIPFVSGSQWLVAPNVLSSGRWQIYVPELGTGYVSYYSTTTGAITTYNYNATSTSLTQGGDTLTINRIECTKYEPIKVMFINRYGVQQDLWFFLKEVKSVRRSNESYQSNTLQTPEDEFAQYSVQDAPRKLFNTQAKQTRSLSSGYYPESANGFFEQLLLSEYVWIRAERIGYAGTFRTIPVIAKTSSMTYKTKLNDRLIEYTIEFEDAFDYINNIR